MANAPILAPESSEFPGCPTEECPTRTLYDDPATDDAFGAHTKIAEAIVEMIKSEPRGRTISIEGEYGSGKSTVIRQVDRLLNGENGLTTEPEYRMVVFDAWAHQGDALRRAFLLQVIGTLRQDPAWLPKAFWEEKASSLASRTETTTSTSRTPLSRGQVLLAGLAAAGIPIGAALISAGFNDAAKLENFWAFLGGFGLIIVLVLVAAVALIRDRASVLPETITARTDTTSDREPDSIDFGRTFGSIAEATSRQGALVLVIDNLDRIDDAEAHSAWSTLRPFLEAAYAKNRVWLLVPVDGATMRHRYHEWAALFDRVRHVTFFVPRPVLSDWQAYVRRLLLQALPRHAADPSIDRIEHLLAVDRDSPGATLTPRELLSIVNQIGAAHRIAPRDIPLTDVSYFALKRRSQLGEREFLSGLREWRKNFPARDLSITSPRCVENMAALHYLSPRDRAVELLLEEPIQAALQSGDASAVDQMAMDFPGALRILERIARYSGQEWSAEEVANCGLALATFGNDSGRYSADVRDRVGRAVRHRLDGLDSWHLDYSQIAARHEPADDLADWSAVLLANEDDRFGLVRAAHGLAVAVRLAARSGPVGGPLRSRRLAGRPHAFNAIRELGTLERLPGDGHF